MTIRHSLVEGKMLYLPGSVGARKQTEQTHTNIFLLPVLWSDARAPYRNTCGYQYHRTQGRPTRSSNHEFSKIGTQGAGPFPLPSSARYGQNKHLSEADDGDSSTSLHGDAVNAFCLWINQRCQYRINRHGLI